MVGLGYSRAECMFVIQSDVCDEEVKDASTCRHGRKFKDAGSVTPRRSRTFSHEPFIINQSKIEQTTSQKTQCSDKGVKA